jgi:hypothetical protein
MTMAIRIIGVDANGIPRVWGEHPKKREVAIQLCKEQALDYVGVRPSTGPLSKWIFKDREELEAARRSA